VLPLEKPKRRKANSISPVRTVLWICKHNIKKQRSMPDMSPACKAGTNSYNELKCHNCVEII